MNLNENVPEDKFFIEESIEFVTKVYGGSLDDWFKTKGKKEMDTKDYLNGKNKDSLLGEKLC